jgi:biopolymer transport protein ExbD
MAGGGGGGGEGSLDVNLNLTPLLDVLMNLLFFLMFGYAAQQYSMEVAAGVELPESSAEIAPKRDFQIIISEKDIRVDEEILVAIPGGKIPPRQIDKEGNILPLYRRLLTIKEKRPPSLPDADIAFILSDKKTDYGLIRQVMTTAAQAGFIKYRLAVLME